MTYPLIRKIPDFCILINTSKNKIREACFLCMHSMDCRIYNSPEDCVGKNTNLDNQHLTINEWTVLILKADKSVSL